MPNPVDPNVPLIETHDAEITLAPAEKLGDDHMAVVAQRRIVQVATLIDTTPIETISLLTPNPFGPVERDPSIQALLRQVEMELDPAGREAMERLWQRQMTDLGNWYREPGLSFAERQYRRDVLNRYMEIMSENLTDRRLSVPSLRKRAKKNAASLGRVRRCSVDRSRVSAQRSPSPSSSDSSPSSSDSESALSSASCSRVTSFPASAASSGRFGSLPNLRNALSHSAT